MIQRKTKLLVVLSPFWGLILGDNKFYISGINSEEETEIHLGFKLQTL